MVFIDDPTVHIVAGDEIRRVLPNGREEVFSVVDPAFYEAFGLIAAHYQVAISRKGEFERGKGGYYINVTGEHSRINISSIDNSINSYGENSPLFGQIREAIERGVEDPEIRKRASAALDQMKSAKEKASFITGYQEFVSCLANHVTVIAPFLPALTEFLSR